ncbi:hypothetical protein RCL1_004516 [Eukaryota sp. TZLM3-RCL]
MPPTCLHCTSSLTSFTKVENTVSDSIVSLYSDAFGQNFNAFSMVEDLTLYQFKKLRRLACRFTLCPQHLFLQTEGPLLFTDHFSHGTLSSLLRSGFQLSTNDFWLVLTQLLYSLNSLSRSSINACSLGLDEVIVTSLEPLRIKLCPIRTISNGHSLSIVNCNSDPSSSIYSFTVCFHRILVELFRAAYPQKLGNIESLYSLSSSSLDFADELLALIQVLDKSWSFNPVLLMPKIQECYALLTPKNKPIELSNGLIRHVIYQSLCTLRNPLLQYDLVKNEFSVVNSSFHKILNKWTRASNRLKTQFLQSWRLFLHSSASCIHSLTVKDESSSYSYDSDSVVTTCCSVEDLTLLKKWTPADSFFNLFPVRAIKCKFSDLAVCSSSVSLSHAQRLYLTDNSAHSYDAHLERRLKVINTFSRLEELCLENFKFVDFSAFNRASQLQHLRLTFTGAPSNLIGLHLLKNLHSLCIKSCSLMDISFLQFLPFLSHLDLYAPSVSDISAIRYCPELSYCKLKHCEIVDFPALNHFNRLTFLSLRKNESLVDISFLSGLQHLEELDLERTAVVDITPLSTCVQLRILNLSSTSVTILSPLRHCVNLELLHAPTAFSCGSVKIQPLTEFLGSYRGLLFENLDFIKFVFLRTSFPVTFSSIKSLNLTDYTGSLELLTCFKQLQVLNLSGTLVSDLSSFSSHAFLQELNISITSVTNLLPLQYCRGLQRLNISGCKVACLVPLSYCLKLVRLEAANTLVSDLFPLSECSQLSYLDLRRTFVSRDYWKVFEDATIIKKLIATFEHGVTVDLARFVTDISPFSMCPRLISFTLTMSPLSDISSLSHCPNLSYLNLSRTLVSDISALKSCLKLQTLNLSYCPVIAIDSLSNCTMLKSLNIAATSVSDLTPLSNCNELSLIDVSYTPFVYGQELPVVVQGNSEVQVFISGSN